MSNVFEIATREKLRFDTSRGQVTVEDLWDMPLQGKNQDDFSLDEIAIALDKAIKEGGHTSFVSKKTRSTKILEIKLEVVKTIIEYNLQKIEDSKNRLDKKAKKEKLLALKAKKQDAALEELSEEDIDKQLAELENEPA